MGNFFDYVDGTTYFLVEVNTLEKAEVLRRIRNECRKYMTRNTQEISQKEQTNWYNSLEKTQLTPYLFVESHLGVSFTVIGYGVIRVEDGEVLLTGGLTAKSRGRGLGTLLFTQLIQISKATYNLPISLEVQRLNIIARNLYKKLGFTTKSSNNNKVIRMTLQDES